VSTLNTASRLAADPCDVDPIAIGPAMREALEAALDVAPTPTTVLLLGESGTGKELIARLLHARSGRRGPWVAVNCAALPAELLESELFGHEKGAFTGAAERRTGKFEQAHRGTLLLDEVSELPLALQAKLLRVIQEREVDRVGGARPVPVDVRIVATTNRDLAEMVKRGEFRSDLYYRLDVFPIVLPPLRARPEDLPALARALLADAARGLGRPAPDLDAAAIEALRGHAFPGNVRELRNVLERALVRCHGPVLGAGHLRIVPNANATAASTLLSPLFPFPLPSNATRTATATATLTSSSTSTVGGETFPSPLPLDRLPLDLSDLERVAIAEALRRVKGNRTHAARLLGIGLRTLRNKLRAYRESGVEVEPGGSAESAGRQGAPCAPGGASAEAHGGRCEAQARDSQEDEA
jgi:two-component system response regulator FlrC